VSDARDPDDGPSALGNVPRGSKKGKDKPAVLPPPAKGVKVKEEPTVMVATPPPIEEPDEEEEDSSTASLEALSRSSVVDRLDTDSLLEELERDLSMDGGSDKKDGDDPEAISKKILEDL